MAIFGLFGKKKKNDGQPPLAAPGPSALAAPLPPEPLPVGTLATAAGQKQRKKSGAGQSMAQPIAPRSSTMPATAPKGRTLLGY